MVKKEPQSLMRAALYGGAAMLLLFDLFFLAKALFTGNFVPIVPIVAGVFTALGLLFIVYAENKARELDKEDHRRISRVAHQLESPLLALESDLKYLITHSQQLPPEARLKLKHMETKSKVLLENIRDVFLMFRALEAPIAQEKRVYDACVLVKEVIDAQRMYANAKNIEITHKAHCESASIRVDRRLMNIVLTHMLENGILYTLTPGIVNVVILKGKNHVRIMVQDRGVGIQKADRDVVFQPFARGAKAQQFDPDGIGVGLTLARLIIREFGGDLKYSPRPAKAGSQFEITLPLAKK